VCEIYATPWKRLQLEKETQKKIYEPLSNEITWRWRKLCTHGLCNPHTSANIVR